MMNIDSDVMRARVNDLLNVINMDSNKFIQSMKDKGFEWDDEIFKVDSFKLETVKTLITFIIEDIENGDIN